MRVDFSWGTMTRYRPEHEGNEKIAVFIGHSVEDGGSFGECMTQNEHDFFVATAHKLGDLAAKVGFRVDVYNRISRGWPGWSTMKDELNDQHASDPYALHIMLHYNDYNGRASGTMCCYWHTSTMGKRAAHIFAPLIGRLYGIKHVGWDGKGGAPLKRGKRANHMVRLPAPPSIIIEHGFGDNERDAAAMIKCHDLLPAILLAGVQDYTIPF